MIAPDPDGARLALAVPPDFDSPVAIERSRGEITDQGVLDCVVEGAATTELGTVDIRLEPGESRTLVLTWNDPVTGVEENCVHLCCLAPGADPRPGLSELG